MSFPQGWEWSRSMSGPMNSGRSTVDTADDIVQTVNQHVPPSRPTTFASREGIREGPAAAWQSTSRRLGRHVRTCYHQYTSLAFAI